MWSIQSLQRTNIRRDRESACGGADADRSAGCPLKEPEGQLTLQAQTEGGLVDLLVCDYRGGEIRGYVRHDEDRPADLHGTADAAGPVRKGYLAITFDQPVANERYQGIVPLEGKSLAEAAQSYFAQSEQILSLGGSQPRSAATAGSRAACSCSTCRRAKKGASGCTRGSTIPTGHAAILGGSVKPGRVGSRASARRPHLAPVPRGGRGADAGGDPAQSRLPLRPGICALGHRALADEREAMVGDDGLIWVDCAFAHRASSIGFTQLT